MQFSDIEDRYLNRMTEQQFPTLPVEPAGTVRPGAMQGEMTAIEQSPFEALMEKTGATLEEIGMALDSLGKVNVGGIEIGIRDLLPFVGGSEKRIDPFTGEESVVQVGTPQALQKAGRGESLTRGTGFATQLVPDAKLAAFDVPTAGAALKSMAKVAKSVAKSTGDIITPNGALNVQEPAAAAAQPAPVPARKRGASAASADASIDGPGAIETVQFVELPDGKFATSTVLQETRKVAVGFDRASTPAEAAHITASLRKSPQEQLVAVVLDENDKPIQIIRHTIGLAGQTSAEPFSLLGSIANTPGAKSFWLSHNHPSGTPELSAADRRLAQAVDRLSKDTGIQMRGILAIAKSKFAAYTPDGDDIAASAIPAAARSKKIDMVERVFRKSGLLDSMQVSNSQEARAVAQQVAGSESGLVLFNGRRQPVAFIPMGNADLENLRQTGVAKQIFGALEKANATATMYVTKLEPNMEGIANLQEMLQQVGSPMFDALGGVNRESLVNRLPTKFTDFKSVFPAAAAGAGALATMQETEGEI